MFALARRPCCGSASGNVALDNQTWISTTSYHAIADARGPPASAVHRPSSAILHMHVLSKPTMENGDMKMRTLRSRAINVARLAGSARCAAFCYTNTTCATRACCARGSFIASRVHANTQLGTFNWKLPTRTNSILAILWGYDCAAKLPRSHCSLLLRCSNRCAA